METIEQIDLVEDNDRAAPGSETIARSSPPAINSVEIDPSAYAHEAWQRQARLVAKRHTKPELSESALYGLAGDIVRAASPYTEAAPAAMLITLLVGFGAMVGRGAYIINGGKPHYPVLFAVLVGPTGRGRKGTSMAAIKPFLHGADATGQFFAAQVARGVQSGEALIQLASTVDGGRLLVEEEEYARLLTVKAWSGSTISAHLRTAWDGEPLCAVTKRSHMSAPDAHVCLIGHITDNELRRKMAAEDVHNGAANRILHTWSERARLLPNPDPMPVHEAEVLSARLREAVTFAQGAGMLAFSPGFKGEWIEVYSVTETRPSGGTHYDGLTARASSHIKRLALMYALLDRSRVVGIKHLTAAQAMWEYCEHSVAYIWGMGLGDSRVERLLEALHRAGEAGLNRTQITDLFHRNLPKEQLDDICGQIVRAGLAKQLRLETGGAPATVLIARP